MEIGKIKRIQFKKEIESENGVYHEWGHIFEINSHNIRNVEDAIKSGLEYKIIEVEMEKELTKPEKQLLMEIINFYTEKNLVDKRTKQKIHEIKNKIDRFRKHE